MTALDLLATICAALLVQAVAGAGVIAWRRRAGEPSSGAIADPVKRSTETGAWPAWRDFRVTAREYADVAKSQCSFILEPVDGVALPAFCPGQYLTFTVGLQEGAGSAAGTVRKQTRCYSLSDRPDPTHYRVTIKRTPAPLDRPEWPAGVVSTHFHDRVQVGAVLAVKAPSGHFILDAETNAPAVFIAGGIGITPLLSMLQWCTTEQPGRSIHLFYGVRNSADHAFKRGLEELATANSALTLTVVYSRPAPGDALGRDYQRAGMIDLALLRSSLPQGRHQFYICGPPPMMRSLVPALRGWGVDEQDIHFESFGPASVRTDSGGTNEPVGAAVVSLGVQLTRSGRTLVWDGRDANLLDFVERQGVAVEAGCRSGSCGTCATPLISGTVAYPVKPDFDIARGQCLLCVGIPQSALVLEA